MHGFLKCRITGGKLYATYYYTIDKKTWQTWDAPVYDLIMRSEVDADEVESLLKEDFIIAEPEEDDKISNEEDELKK